MRSKACNYWIIFLILFISSCEKFDRSEERDFVLSGNITSVSGELIYPVYIFENNSLLAIRKDSNQYSLELKPGPHEITFSALAYKDARISTAIDGDNSLNITLEDNNETGRIYGEFQDSLLFQQKISENNELSSWTALEIMDGVSGATLMEDNVGSDFQQAQLFLGDSLLTYGDVYGQYWIEIQCGTYPITGVCAGFTSKTKLVQVLPDTKVYMNYYLRKE